MAAERCKRCGKPRIGKEAGEEGFCTGCLLKLKGFARELDEKKDEMKGGRGKGPSPKLLSLVRQSNIDRLYEKHLRCRDLCVFVSANESGGFGDLINCLNTSQILIESGNNWRAFARCNHDAFATMLESFPDVETNKDADPLDKGDCVVLDVVSRAGNEKGGSIDEYGFQDPKDQSVYCRGAGLALHEMGIMINEALRKAIAPVDLPLSIGPIAEIVVNRAKLGKLRFFFGYGAGQKEPDCFHVLLDRVAFDQTINHAVVLPVNHGPGHLDAYLKNQQRAKALGIKAGMVAEEKKIPKGLSAYRLPLPKREIFVIFPQMAIPYKDMLTLWRAADRSFTICEGDQSFSEAISACIPMAYQLWNPKGGGPAHKTRLFSDLLTFCEARDSDVMKFLDLCQKYGRKKFDEGTVGTIVKLCNDEKFLQTYQKCMIAVAEARNIAHAIPPFVKRLWLRKVLDIGLCPDTLQGEVKELFAMEDKDASLGKIEAQLFRLNIRLAKLARKLTEEQRFRREMNAPRSPNDLNYQVASALAQVEVYPKLPRLTAGPEIQLQVALKQLNSPDL